MALKGLDIFKLTPKKNCKECGCPTCMAFSMKVAQGALPIEKCPHMSAEALAKLSDATAPLMKTITVGAGETEHKLGGETVLYRHEKTFVSRPLFAVAVDAVNFDEKLPAIKKVDYERIGERMYAEVLCLRYTGDAAAYAEFAKKAAAEGRVVMLDCADVEAAKAALAAAGQGAILNGANADNYKEMVAAAQAANAVLGVSGKTLEELHDTVEAIEGLGYKNLILDVTCGSIKEAFSGAVQVRRASLKDQDRTFGYPSIVDLAKVAPGNRRLQCALASVFVIKYGSVIVMDEMTYAEALPLYGLRQNIYTDPQKPMRVTPGIYALNGADENSPCAMTVDFALTYFVVSGEMERSGVPVNLLISDAGGYSVLTSWAAGKFSAGSITRFIQENDIESKIKSRTLIIPGKVAVLKGELEEKLPGWTIVVAPKEATGLVRFLKDFQ